MPGQNNAVAQINQEQRHVTMFSLADALGQGQVKFMPRFTPLAFEKVNQPLELKETEFERRMREEMPGIWAGTTSARLEIKHVSEPEMIVEGFIPEGFTLLAGPPKDGKSFLCEDIALSVALGIPTLGKFETMAGDVLYIAREDTESRLKFRQRKILKDRSNIYPANLAFLTECERMPKFFEQVRIWHRIASNPRL